MKNLNKNSTLLIFIVATFLLLPACGFHLRGETAALSEQHTPTFIGGLAKFHPLHRELAKQLTRAGNQMAVTRQDAQSLIIISDYKQKKRVLSLDSRNKAVEHEIEESLDFKVIDNRGKLLMAKQHLRTLRIIPEAIAIASRNREERQLREDMRKELADRIIQRLAAQL